jgi:hypothetical protein
MIDGNRFSGAEMYKEQTNRIKTDRHSSLTYAVSNRATELAENSSYTTPRKCADRFGVKVYASLTADLFIIIIIILFI